MENLSIKIPSSKENVSVVEQFIEQAKTTYNISEDIYGNMLVAVTESVSNAIIHGNKLNKEKLVDLELSMDQSKVCIAVKDEGIGYDYENVPDPTSPENLKKPGGRGLFLMKHLADKVEFFDKGKKVHMTFHV